MILKGKTREQITEEKHKEEMTKQLNIVQSEVEDEIQSILRNMAIERYIEKNMITDSGI